MNGQLRTDKLRRAMRGLVLLPGEHGYEVARRVWNGAVDRYPAAIARCLDSEDVISAIRFAANEGIHPAVRGGGHSVSGVSVCDDGLVIDLSLMRDVSIDPGQRSARVQGGALWSDLDGESQRFGLATTGGIVSHTGVAGLTLGGGIGWLMRPHGLSADNLRSIDLVTADGREITANGDEHPDLYWALKGGGGNFGIATSLDFDLHPVGPTVLAGPMFFALEDAPAVVAFYRDWIVSSPDELTTILNFRRAPSAAFLPPELHGRPVMAVVTCFSGSVDDGERVLAPLRACAQPLIDLIRPRPYVELQTLFDPLVPHGWHYHWKSSDVSVLSDSAVAALVAHTAAITSTRSYTLVFQLGGAVASVADEASAYSHRSAGFAVNINAAWLPDDPEPEAHVAWTRRLHSAIQSDAIGVYVNFLGFEGEERIRAAYGDHKFARLREVKRMYDPNNLLQGNQNIAPGAPL